MVHGIGVDILKINNLANSVSDISDPFVKKVYTEKELALINSRSIPLNSFATRFSGKEAVFKALSIHGNSIKLNEIEILENEVGKPFVILHGRAKELAQDNGINQVLISLSYDTEYAISYAMALKI